MECCEQGVCAGTNVRSVVSEVRTRVRASVRKPHCVLELS